MTSSTDNAVPPYSNSGEIFDEAKLDAAFATLREHADRLGAWADGWLAAWNTHDLDAVVGLTHPDIVYVDPSMFGEHITGHAQFRSFVAAFWRAFPDATFHSSDWPVHVALDGVGVAVPWRVTGTFTGDWKGGPSPLELAPTGRAIDVTGVDLYQFHDGVLLRWESVVDVLDIAQQVGIAPLGKALPTLVRLQRALAPLLRRLYAK
jgi:steroid delta-isomerase-like uncharacterized protein